MNKYISIALKEACKAERKGDVPIGAIIVENNKIISKAHNKKEKNKIATNHAEILAINKACKKKKSWHLDDCILYCTMEPCMMCCGAILQARIKKIYYMVKNDKFGCTELLKNSKIDLIQISDNDKVKEMLNNFFKKKR